MASFKNHFLLRNVVVLMIIGLASGDVLDELLDDDELLLYLAIGLLCFSVLFLFIVILMITVATIRIHKFLKAREDYPHRNSDTVIANSHVFPLSERRLNEPTKWDQYLPEIRNGRELNSATNVDYLDYMDLIIMDASKMSLPRARVESGEKTV